MISSPEVSTNIAPEWARSKTPLIWLLALTYILVVKVCPNRIPTVRHGLLPLWYYSVGLLQLVLLIAFLPEMRVLLTEGWTGSVCSRGSLYTDSFTGHVVLLFVITKVVDLIETMLIITEGRNPLDIHVFHHTVTLIYVWESYTDQSSMARWFVLTNLVAHTLLYSYLSPRKFGISPCWLTVAVAQLLSLVICLLATFTAQRVLDAGGRCDVTYWRLSVDKLILAVFITIFADFYHQKFRDYRDKHGGGKVLARSRRRQTRRRSPPVKTAKRECGIHTGVNAVSAE